MNLWTGIWWLLVWSSIIWYAVLVVVIGWNGCRDMLRLLKSLE